MPLIFKDNLTSQAQEVLSVSSCEIFPANDGWVCVRARQKYHGMQCYKPVDKTKLLLNINTNKAPNFDHKESNIC